MSEIIFCCHATGRQFASGFVASRNDLQVIPEAAKMRLRCAICGETHQFDFARIRLCECPRLCRERKDCQRCGFAHSLM